MALGFIIVAYMQDIGWNMEDDKGSPPSLLLSF
jgi:hypothetical protein